MALGGSLPQINLGVQGVTQGGHHILFQDEFSRFYPNIIFVRVEEYNILCIILQQLPETSMPYLEAAQQTNEPFDIGKPSSNLMTRFSQMKTGADRRQSRTVRDSRSKSQKRTI
ncbi:hypothetical protein TNCV_1730741 [Trichonephila clavipes]|nr:hypothetical protein TNCV_1730741 [Trichonephila clavipes]